MARKKIALLTINPDSESTERIMTGILEQCQRYDYDLAVFLPMVHITNFVKDYLHGELNIYELCNFDEFDGVIITPIPMQEDLITTLTDRLLEKIQKECHVPVVSVNLDFGDYDVVYSDEHTAVETIAEHVVTVHGAKNIYVLTGPHDFPISNIRADAIRGKLSEYNIPLPEENIFYGDFWYTSGENLADRIISGEIAKPDAVLCTSDHMAIGLANRLLASGIKVPEDIIITGNGGAKEALLNIPNVTTYEAEDECTGAEAVNRLRELMGDGECVSKIRSGKKNMCLGETCGCTEDSDRIRRRIQDMMYTSDYNTALPHDENGINLTTLMESFISEKLTASEDAETCLNRIYETSYLLKPYGKFYLCLNDTWLNVKKDSDEGYPRKMNLTVFAQQKNELHGYENHIFFKPELQRPFDSKKMLPAMWEEHDEPQVYYFTPVHFGRTEIGYVVLQNPVSYPVRMGRVYGMYLRYINTGLEMARIKNTVLNLSEHDSMTGLYNRRGFERCMQEQIGEATEEDSVLVLVIDMNNLKLINDTLGHYKGDEGIKTIAKATKATTKGKEISVRAGGDEFYLVGIGKYTEEDGKAKVEEFKQNLKLQNEKVNAEWEYQAAVGYSVMSMKKKSALQQAISKADIAMYVDKRQKADFRI